MFEGHSRRPGHARPEAQSRHDDADRAQTARAREAAEALFTPPRRATEPPAKSPASEPENPSGEGPRKPRILRALSQQPAPEEPSAKPAITKPALAAQPKLAEIPASDLPRIRIWLKYGMTVPQVAEVYDVADGEIERALEKPR